VRIDLLDGQHATMRDDVERIPHGDRKRIMRAWQSGTDDTERGMKVTEALLVVLVTDWTLDLPLPREKPEVIDELAGHDFDVLQHAAVELQKRLYVDFSPTPDPSSPPVPSAA
jgi:hypothetical protein